MTIPTHNHLTKLHWLDRAIEVRQFHISQMKEESNWTVEKTANILNRSIGSISQDLTLASWAKTHDKQLRRCSSMRDALSWIKDKQREMMLEEN